MYAESQRHLSAQTRLLVAAVVGLIIGVLTLFLLSLPNWGLLSQLALFPLLERVSILVKVLSPLLLLLIVGGWTWVILWKWGDHLLASLFQARPPSGPAHNQDMRRATSSVAPSYQSDTPTPATPQQTPIAVPPLFQLEHPAQARQFNLYALPATPVPATSPTWSQPFSERQEEEEPENGEDSSPQITAAERIKQDAQQDIGTLPGTTPPQDALPDLPQEQTAGKTHEAAPLRIFLLKRVRVQLHADGITQEVKLRRGENAIRLILLAYVAWKKGEAVDRDKMLTYVLGRGRRRDMDTDQLTQAFDNLKKFLREDLVQAINQFNEQAGREILSIRSIGFFSNEPGAYWLHPSCQVVDLEAIDKPYQIILQARKDGLLDEKLDGSPPQRVVTACQQLVNAYPGDFLQELIERHPEEFGSWVREPVTMYRDYYLDALWQIALAESALGKHFSASDLSEEKVAETRRYHTGRAAQLFYDYAMDAIASKVDSKLKFAYKDRSGSDGARINAAERAMRRCVVELSKIGKTETIDQVYDTFKEKMLVLSEHHWTPDPETEHDVVAAKEQTTSAYRFSPQQ